MENFSIVQFPLRNFLCGMLSQSNLNVSSRPKMLSLRWINFTTQFFRQRALSTTACTRHSEIIKEATEEAEKTEETSIDPRDRSRVISVETSIKYINSPAFFKSYGGELVWKLYRRNFKGGLPPETRKTCIRAKTITTASPCPICRDEYLVVDYRNVELLKQFVTPSNTVLPTKKTGVCQKQYQKLLVAVKKAKDYGLLTFEVPHRLYNYSLYSKQ